MDHVSCDGLSVHRSLIGLESKINTEHSSIQIYAIHTQMNTPFSSPINCPVGEDDYLTTGRIVVDSDEIHQHLFDIKTKAEELSEEDLDRRMVIVKRHIGRLRRAHDVAEDHYYYNKYWSGYQNRYRVLVLELEEDVSKLLGWITLWETILADYTAILAKKRLPAPAEDAVEPQFLDVGSIMVKAKDMFRGFLEELGHHATQNHKVVMNVFKVVLVYILATHVRHYSWPRKFVISFLSMLVMALLMTWMSRLGGTRMLRREMSVALKRGDRKTFVNCASRLMPDSEVMDFEYWFDSEWKKDVTLMLGWHGDDDDEGASDFDEELDLTRLVPQIGGGQAAFVAGAMFFLTKRVPLYRAVVDHDKLQRNLNAMFCGTVGSLEATLNTILRMFGRKQVILLKAHEKIINDWEFSVRAFVNRVRLGSTSPMTASAQLEYDRYRDQGLGLEHLHKDPLSRSVIKRGMDALGSVACFFSIRGDCSSRMEPVVLCLAGGAGTGKTTLARMLSSQLANHMCTSDEIRAVGGDLSKLCFQKGTSEYWEGYCGQPICVMDDWLQAIPETGIENEVVNFIRAANQWPYPLNMASLDMKGKVNFTSRAILMTTNVTNKFYVSRVVTCPAAVARRMDLCFDVSVKPGFIKNGHLDVGRVSAIKASSIKDYDDVWNFRVLDIMTEGSSGVDYNISDVVRMMKASYDFRLQSENNTRDFVKNFADLPLEPQIFGGKAALTIGVGIAGALAFGVARRVGKVAQVVGKAVTKVRALSSGHMRVLALAGLTYLTHAVLAKLVVITAAFVRCFLEILRSGLSLLGFRKRAEKVEPQGGASDPVLDRVRKNMTAVEAVYKHGSKRIGVGFGLFLTARHIVVPYHFMREVRSGICSISVRDSVGVVDLGSCPVVKEAPMMVGGMRDFCILDIRRNFTGVRDIRSHFSSLKSIRNTVPGYFVKPASVASTVVGCLMTSKNYTNIMSDRVSLVQHSMYTVKGDCGAVLMSRNISDTKRIRGIHVAGLEHGYYCPLYAEDMPDYVDSQAFCGFEEIANVKAVYNNGETGIAPTFYSGFFVEPKGGPACLRPSLNADGVLVDPMLSVVERSNRDFDSIELPKHTDRCVSAVIGEIFDDIGDADLSPLSYEEAVAGIAGDDFVKGIARGKSMGYPLCTKYSNKRPAFGAEGPYVFDTPAAAEVKTCYDALIADYESGRRSAVFRDCLKDEVLKAEKVAKVDTRLISASPVHFTILVKRLFGRFAAQFMRKRLKHGALVGINVYSPEWSVISDSLRSANRESLAAAGDYKAFDKSQHPHIMRAIMMEIAMRLPHYKEFEKLFEGIAMDTSEAFHLGGNSYRSWVIYKIIGTLPSGHPLTSILNSIYNLVVFRMCWCDMFGEDAVTSFRDKVRCYVYGDDNIFAPTDDCMGFDLTAMAKFCPKIGMVYTSEDKTEDLYTLKPVGACSFLKRKFSLDPDGYVYAPLEFYSIGDMLNWRKKKITDEEHLEQVSEAVIREVAAYDFGTFSDVLARLRLLLRRVGVRDPTRGIGMEYAYQIARSWYRGYTPVWSIDE